MVTTRVGQGKYRRRLVSRWKNKCAVTGCGELRVLIASHILPWRDASPKQRIDVDNGLLLSPIYDGLFDRHLISFADDGKIMISKDLSRSDRKKFGITGSEQIMKLSEGNIKYLKLHREKLL